MSEQAKRYTVKDLSEIIGTVENTIRKKIKKHQFVTVQEIVNNRLTTLVELNEDQLEALIKEIDFNRSKVNSSNVVSDHSVSVQPMVTEPQDYMEILREVKELAMQAGQVKLLTQDNEFYKNEYFRLKFEKEELTKVNVELTKENLVIKQENEQLKKSSWKFWQK